MTKSRVERGAHKHRWSDIGSGPQREHFEARRIDVRPSGADFTVLGVKVCAPSRSALVDVGTSSAVFAFAWIAITSEKAMTRTRLGSRDHPTTVRSRTTREERRSTEQFCLEQIRGSYGNCARLSDFVVLWVPVYGTRQLQLRLRESRAKRGLVAALYPGPAVPQEQVMGGVL